MSYQRLYPQRINWENEPSIATPLNEVNLNKMDSALYGIDGRVVELDENKVGFSDTFSTAKNGVVPKPTQADITGEKVLRADGTWVTQSGGGGGGGGHKIVNNAGTELTQRSKLKTVGGLNATDDSVNDTTEITDVYEEVPWATWQGYPSEAAALQAHPNCVVTGAPDCDGDIEIENMHLAWENPSPTSDYGTNQITLNIGNYGTYDKIRVEAHLGKNDSKSVYTEFDISDGGACLRYEYTGATNVSVRRRDITNDGNNQITFGGAYFQVAGQTLTNDNGQLIPLRVYVYKKKLTAKIQAIATNVKATVDYSTSEHKIGKWIDGSDLYEKTIDYGTLPNTDRVLVNHNISNLASVYEIRAIAVSSSQSFAIPTANPSAQNASINVEVTSTQIGIRTGRDFSSYNAYVTLRYTKTS